MNALEDQDSKCIDYTISTGLVEECYAYTDPGRGSLIFTGESIPNVVLLLIR